MSLRAKFIAGALAAATIVGFGARPAQAQNADQPKITTPSAPTSTTSNFNSSNGNPGTVTSPSVTVGSPSTLSQAGDYSEQHPVVTIAIAKGKKDDKLTGEQIGQVLSKRLERFDVPSKYFITETEGYTAIAFFVAGKPYGAYGLNDSLAALVHVAVDYEAVVRPHVATWPNRRDTGAPIPIASRSPGGRD